MSHYIVIHALKKTPDEFNAMMASDDMPEFAKAMAEGQTPAKCLKSWNPLPYGNADPFVCLWEASDPSDISATLGDEMLEYITCNPMQVDEIDWAQMAASVS